MNDETKLAAAAIILWAFGCALVVLGLGGPRSAMSSLGVGIICVCVAFTLFELAWKGRR